MKKKLLALIVVALALVAYAGGSCYLHSLKVKEERLQKEAKAWQKLEHGVLSRISLFKGEVGLAIEDLATGRKIQLNQEKPFASASMVKVPIMVTYFEAQAQGICDINKNFVLCNESKASGSGKLKDMPAGTQISPQDLVELMISESDNTAANMLIESFGFEYLNESFKQLGLRNTNISRKMMDFKDRKNGVENYTTAKDLATLFKNMYFGTPAHKKIFQKCLEILKKQKINDRIPALLPAGCIVAHKTGLEYGVCHDAGIMYTSRGNFLICVLIKHNASTARSSKRLIAKLAKDVYDYAMMN